MSTRIPIILGAGQFGHPNTSNIRVSDPALVQEFIDTLLGQGHVGIDTSRFYCDGTSEELLGSLDLRGAARIDTKNFPLQDGDHLPEKIKETFDASLKALNGKKIRVYYLHKPDRTVPFEKTLEAIDAIHKAGGFEEFGLSNYAAWEVAEIVGIAERRGFVKPTVYQGGYNLIDRLPEAELFPCLRKFGIRFAAYSALAGGYLTDRFFAPGTEGSLSKFDPGWQFAFLYANRYYPAAPAVAELKNVAKEHGLTLTEVGLRWLQWHSKLQPGDLGVVIAVSKTEQLRGAIADSAKGPLPEPVVQACEDVWKKTKGAVSHQYFF
ncbi:aldo/keto reductase [Phanerochaete sordida]|uniref:Aldo/keto reductase n=1 Tax=Phanerochaete sordida TaxID=48140 RepID=A0A9P3GC35_9APHY|nr:aldo/keto reductase [Phanerochaete sordida]